jgi:hypothetical protein
MFDISELRDLAEARLFAFLRGMKYVSIEVRTGREILISYDT